MVMDGQTESPYKRSDWKRTGLCPPIGLECIYNEGIGSDYLNLEIQGGWGSGKKLNYGGSGGSPKVFSRTPNTHFNGIALI